ncbi:MAG: chaperone modulator CbpM [Alphaproteobacteria bacterium]
MTVALAELARLVAVTESELEAWVAEGWVRPVRSGDAWEFGEIDVARARLIHEVRVDFEVGSEAVPLVLSLVDQLHAARRDVRALIEALAREPADVRERILAKACS